MEILASALMLASVVLPILFVIAFLAFVGILAYSWIADLRTRPEPEPAVAVAQQIPVPASRRAAMPAA